MIVSYSRLKLHEDCPYRFFCKYILGLDDTTTLPMALGKAVHKAIESKIKGMPHELALVIGYAEGNHPELTKEEMNPLVSNAPFEQFMGGNVEVEQHFVLPLVEDIQIQGYLDIADKRGYFVGDWKTNRMLYQPTDNHQLGIYAWALNQLYGHKYIKGTLYFLRYYKQQEKSKIYNKNEMEQAKAWAIKIALDIKKNKTAYEQSSKEEAVVKKLFPCKPNKYCKGCPFATDCYFLFND